MQIDRIHVRQKAQRSIRRSLEWRSNVTLARAQQPAKEDADTTFTENGMQMNRGDDVAKSACIGLRAAHMKEP
jgi:hypothetical protein